MDRQRRADRRGHRLLDQVGLRGTGAPRRLEHRTLLDVGDRRRHAHEHPRALEPRDPGAGEDQADQPLRDLEVGDRPAAQRPHRDDVARRAPDHVPRLVPHRQHLLGAAVEGDDRGLVEDDPLPARVHERVRGAEVDGEVASHGPLALRRGRCSRTGRTSWAALAPVVAPGPVLVLPDRHRLLEGVDREPGGLEGLGPVRRRDDHGDRRLREREVTRAVQEREPLDARASGAGSRPRSRARRRTATSS